MEKRGTGAGTAGKRVKEGLRVTFDLPQ
jgi:hypothetical protein